MAGFNLPLMEQIQNHNGSPHFNVGERSENMKMETGERKDTVFNILFILFFLSGFCGLLYQIIWLRLAFASFGIITPVLSVVLSVFMLGLSVGSWLGGKYISNLSCKTGISAIFFYALAEFLIGVGGLAVPFIFSAGQTLLLASGDFNSLRYLFLSAVILAGSIFPWCVFMGATIPFALAFIQDINAGSIRGFSYLYIANVVGAMFGVSITALFLIELFGLSHTLLISAAFNFIIAITALIMGFKSRREPAFQSPPPERLAVSGTLSEKLPSGAGILAVLFITGFTSMAMEVVWTRAFTPVLKTTIYSFASILAVYLFATWQGSGLYRRTAEKQRVKDISVILSNLAWFCLLPVLASDVRLWGVLPADGKITFVLISIFPFCAALGYLTPKLIDEFSSGNPELAGKAYAINTVGCILGPLVAGYVLLPRFGVKTSLIILAVPFLIFSFAYYSKKILRDGFTEISAKNFYAVVSGGLTVILFLGAVFFFIDYENNMLYKFGEIRRDYAATVISEGEGMGKRLLVNGIGMTSLTPITKYMSHVPLAIREKKPVSALIICFGMGTTFRSAVSWGVETTAIELVPGVREAFGFYFKDAPDILQKPGARIIVDDGRRFLKRSSKKFDIITIDPPPPVESAGSSLLYSVDFYRILKTRLKDDGILAQWFPNGERMTFKAIAKSLSVVFPYVRVFHSVEDWGFHFFASDRPFEMPKIKDFVRRVPAAAAFDLVEWNPDKTPAQLYGELLKREISLAEILTSDVDYLVTDDRPFNEYFWVRRTWYKLTGRRRQVKQIW